MVMRAFSMRWFARKAKQKCNGREYVIFHNKLANDLCEDFSRPQQDGQMPFKVNSFFKVDCPLVFVTLNSRETLNSRFHSIRFDYNIGFCWQRRQVFILNLHILSCHCVDPFLKREYCVLKQTKPKGIKRIMEAISIVGKNQSVWQYYVFIGQTFQSVDLFEAYDPNQLWFTNLFTRFLIDYLRTNCLAVCRWQHLHIAEANGALHATAFITTKHW
ncbi:hypothetical protein LOAG_05262 [Loa loa]|uniref:Uncharacterized protein n=1 Tax=Loa loa TaxID=7209 RepID=A0A1S0U0K6_LOALO|nr:hypothetical protein LOAG_05262 [Loa loa]EFO23217.1 hypothetical protein LOAG_05262 [Loa loa]